MLGFRISEFTIIVFSKIKILSLIPLSKEYAKAGTTEIEYFKTLGNIVLNENHIAVLMVMIIFAIGALMFYVFVI